MLANFGPKFGPKSSVLVPAFIPSQFFYSILGSFKIFPVDHGNYHDNLEMAAILNAFAKSFGATVRLQRCIR